MSLKEIVAFAIHPGIGIARVGNSPDGYFIGPEVPGAAIHPENGYKDTAGRIKRQVAKFRIYGFDSDGKVVQEVTANDADITWTVHLANKKAAWYCCDVALDVPEAEPVPRRNPSYKENRQDLIIDPGPRSITGRRSSAHFDTGTFLGVRVPLGEIQTDTDGNLLVFGGLGRSESPTNQPIRNFNNKEWFDDISDGPVSAQVNYKGKIFKTTPAWVIVGPPDYAPGITNLVTIYDLIYEIAIQKEWLPRPAELSFTEHIFPIFERLSKLQWVSEGYYLLFGWGARDDFLTPENLKRLASNSSEHKEFRSEIFKRFRNPDFSKLEPDAIPQLFGDILPFGKPTKHPKNWSALTHLQYSFLREWALGNFKPDWDPFRTAESRELERLNVSERPLALNRAALENCLGGPFHPGSEVSWPIRRSSLYSGAFRIKPRPPGQPEKDYGDELSPEEALADDGPASLSAAGDLTRWMAIPWQVDAATCRGESKRPYLPTFWPAYAPNQVLTERHYRKAINQSLSDIQRQKYFDLRLEWLRHYPKSMDLRRQAAKFIEDWGSIGIVTRRLLTTPAPTVSLEVFVEEGNDLINQDAEDIDV